MTYGDLQSKVEAIRNFRAERQAIILAHNYQNDEIQDIADFVGDSLALSQKAAGTEAKVIVFCGVHFMAESASILAPDKTVLLPAPTAGCPMADMAEVSEVLEWRRRYPHAAVVAYVNTSAAVKAVSDYCCTSANAVKLVRSIPEQEIIFLPDQNLGHYVAEQTPEKTFHLWPGYCLTHHRLSAATVRQIREAHPDALILVHPECRPEVVELADFVGSTSQIIRFARETPVTKLIIGTEMGVIHGLKADNPGKTFYLLDPGLVCPNMKQTTIDKVLTALETMTPVISVPATIRAKAKTALDRMISYT